MKRRVAGDILRHLTNAVPCKVRIVLTYKGTHVTEPTGEDGTSTDIKAMRADGIPFRCHSFEATCADLDIERRLTKPATVRRYHDDDHAQLERHLAAFNFGRRLNAL